MRLIKPLAVAIAFHVYATNVVAQSTVLEEVIVTATKKSESLQDIAVTVNAFSSETIQEAGIENAVDVAAMTPSLSINRNLSPFNARMSIRGIGTAQNDPALEPSVGLFVDGVFLGRSGLGMSDLTDIERIEVLQGPQGTLYGKNTNAGAISVITKNPNMEEYEGYVEASIGNYNLQKLTVSATGPLTDTVAFRLAANINQRDGYLDNQGGDDMNDADDWNIRGKLLWEPADSVSVLLSASHVERDTNCCAPEAVQDDNGTVNAELVNQGFAQDKNDPYDYEVAADVPSRFDLESDLVSLTVDYDRDWGSISSITAWNDYDYVKEYDGDRSELDVFAVINDINAGDSLSQELRLSSSIGEQIDYQLGLFYYDQTIERGGETPFAILGSDFVNIFSQQPLGMALPVPVGFVAQPGDSVQYDHKLESETLAAFGQATWHIQESWHLKGGLRWTSEEKKADLLGANTSTAPSFIILGQAFVDGFSTPIDESFKRKSDNVDWLLSLSKDLGDNTMIFASAATGSKSGGFNSVSGAATEREFDDEDTLSYELGIKSTILDSRLRINATAFYTEIEDYQSEQQAPSGAGTFVSNVGAVKTSGVDVSLEAIVLANLTVSAGLLYMHDYEVTEGVDEGSELPFTAEFSGNLAATLVFPLADGSLFGRVDYSYMGEHATNGGSAASLEDKDFDDRNLVNLRLGWRNDQWNIAAWGRNVTSDDYASFTASTIPFSSVDSYFLAPPKTYGVTVRYDF